MNGITNYDVSEIGQIECQLNFDLDSYLEYLEDNSLADNNDTKINFIKNGYCNYDIEFFDSDTYHHMGYDTLTFDELEKYFGESLSNDILKDCMDGETHEYEPYLYVTKNFDLTNPTELSKVAMQCLPHGEYFKNARGFILPNGVVVYTPIEHSQSSKIPGVKGTFHFIELGCIRVLEQGIDIAKQPTNKQIDTLYDIFNSNYGKEFYIDLRGGKMGPFGKKYPYCDGDAIMNDIELYFKGRDLNEKKNKNLIRITESQLKYIIVETIKSTLLK